MSDKRPSGLTPEFALLLHDCDPKVMEQMESRAAAAERDHFNMYDAVKWLIGPGTRSDTNQDTRQFYENKVELIASRIAYDGTGRARQEVVTRYHDLIREDMSDGEA